LFERKVERPKQLWNHLTVVRFVRTATSSSPIARNDRVAESVTWDALLRCRNFDEIIFDDCWGAELSTQNTTADYDELTNDVYALLVKAFASTDKRALNYWKSVWDITSRPDAPVTIDSVIRRNLERANQLTNLTIGEMRSAGRESTAFAKKLLAEGTKVQDTALGSFRRLLDKYAANVNYVKETTSPRSTASVWIAEKQGSVPRSHPSVEPPQWG
jgi:hypothetical protein